MSASDGSRWRPIPIMVSCRVRNEAKILGRSGMTTAWYASMYGAAKAGHGDTHRPEARCHEPHDDGIDNAAIIAGDDPSVTPITSASMTATMPTTRAMRAT